MEWLLAIPALPGLAFVTLLAIALPFILTMIGAGLWISAKADTTDAAGQLVMGTVMPSMVLTSMVASSGLEPAGLLLSCRFSLRARPPSRCWPTFTGPN